MPHHDVDIACVDHTRNEVRTRLASCAEAMAANFAGAVTHLVGDLVMRIRAPGICGELVTTHFSKDASLADIIASLEAPDFDIIAAGDALRDLTSSSKVALRWGLGTPSPT